MKGIRFYDTERQARRAKKRLGRDWTIQGNALVKVIRRRR